MSNFVNCSILPYGVSTFKINSNAWALSPEPRVENEDDIEEDEFCIGDDPSAFPDQYLGGEELEELIMEEENVFDNDFP